MYLIASFELTVNLTFACLVPPYLCVFGAKLPISQGMAANTMTPSELATMSKYLDDNHLFDAVFSSVSDASGILATIPGIPPVRHTVRLRLYRALLRMGGTENITKNVEISNLVISDLGGIDEGDPYQDVFAVADPNLQIAIIKTSRSPAVWIPWATGVGQDRARELLAGLPDASKTEWAKAMLAAGYELREPSPPPALEPDPKNPTRTLDKGKARADVHESSDEGEEGDDSGMDEADDGPGASGSGASLLVRLKVNQPLKDIQYDFGDEVELLSREFQTAEAQVAFEKAKRAGLADYFRLYPREAAARDIRSNRIVTYGAIPPWAAKMRSNGELFRNIRAFMG